MEIRLIEVIFAVLTSGNYQIFTRALKWINLTLWFNYVCIVSESDLFWTVKSSYAFFSLLIQAYKRELASLTDCYNSIHIEFWRVIDIHWSQAKSSIHNIGRHYLSTYMKTTALHWGETPTKKNTNRLQATPEPCSFWPEIELLIYGFIDNPSSILDPFFHWSALAALTSVELLQKWPLNPLPLSEPFTVSLMILHMI